MSLIDFLRGNLEPILVEFEAVARTMIPPAETMSVGALRDHANDILLAIANDMETAQTEPERLRKSRGGATSTDASETLATAHGAMRQLAGFNLNQLGAEFRALRATVLRQWQAAGGVADPLSFEQMIRFNEGMDQALAESIAAYSERMTNARDMFLAVLGHDLRSPLGALSGCIQLLDAPASAPAVRARAAGIANRSVSAINQMITDLLEYTRTRLGRGIEVVPVAGDFGALCQQVFDEARAAHPRRTLTYQTFGDLAFPFDAARMRQVLANLIGNAVQHGDPSSPVTLEARGDPDFVSATVANRGEPISADSMQVIFDPMVQVAKSETKADERPATSLGLGLYIAREIVNAHGGRIEVASTRESGTSFAVRLPRTAKATANPASTSALKPQPRRV